MVMKSISILMLVSVMVVGAGCASSGQKPQISAADCVATKHTQIFNEKCSAPRLGWKGASGSDFTFSQ
jgi:hypothetical protein